MRLQSINNVPSPRELEVLSRVVKGMSNPEIGAELGISKDTVRALLRSISKRLRISGRDKLAAWYLTTADVVASEPDRREAQRLALAQAKSNAAIIRAVLTEYMDRLLELASLVERFSGNPEATIASGGRLSAYLRSQIQLAESNGSEVARLVDELAHETARIRELQLALD